MVHKWWIPTEKGVLNIHDVDGSRLPTVASLNGDTLHQVRNFRIVLYFPEEPPTRELWRNLFRKTPNLSSLQLTTRTKFNDFLGGESIDGQWEDKILSNVFSALRDIDDCAFYHELVTLSLLFQCNNYQNPFDETKHLLIVKRLFLEVLPLFPNLRTLKIVESFLETRHIVEVAKAIVEKEKNSSTCKINANMNLGSIHVFGLPGVLEMSDLRNPRESSPSPTQEAFLKILRSNSFPGLYCIDQRLLSKDSSKAKRSFAMCWDVEGQLLVNHSGRKRFASVRKRPIPKQLWPNILERAFQKSHRVYRVQLFDRNPLRNATGLYELLRNCAPIHQHLVECCSRQNKRMKSYE